MSRDRIAEVTVHTVAIPLDGRFLSSDGTATGVQSRHILEVTTDQGLVGLGEVGPRVLREQIAAAGRSLIGADPFNLESMRTAIASEKFYRLDQASLTAAFQMACLDIQGKAANVRVCDLLGGAARDRVPLIAYVFRKEGTEHGPAVLSNDDLVAHTRDLIDRHGFQTIKLKAGAVDPREEIEAALMLREAFPGHGLRIDPNGAWSVTTTIEAGRRLADAGLEWLEDPVLTIEGMAAVARRIPIPLATNMCCIQPREFPAAVANHAIDVMLLDLWFLGGPWSARHMASTCRTFAIDIGVHSGGGHCEMGVGLAAQIHLAASLPGLTHACDSEMHHLADDVIKAGGMRYEDGCVRVPEGPGLGVELDRDKVGLYVEAHERLKGAGAHGFPAYPRW